MCPAADADWSVMRRLDTDVRYAWLTTVDGERCVELERFGPPWFHNFIKSYAYHTSCCFSVFYLKLQGRSPSISTVWWRGGETVSHCFREMHSPTFFPKMCNHAVLAHHLCCHPFSTTYIFFSKEHQSVSSRWFRSNQLQPCIIILLMWHFPINLPPAHHSQPQSRIRCFIPGSKLTFSTNLFRHRLLAPIEKENKHP